jgi:hypothetical protein
MSVMGGCSSCAPCAPVGVGRGGLVFKDYFRLVTAFLTLESAHLALQASRERHTLDKPHIYFAARASNRLDVGQWDVSKRRVTCVPHGALPQSTRLIYQPPAACPQAPLRWCDYPALVFRAWREQKMGRPHQCAMHNIAKLVPAATGQYFLAFVMANTHDRTGSVLFGHGSAQENVGRTQQRGDRRT